MPDVKWPVELAAIADLHREEEAASRGVIRATPWQPGATAEALSRCEVALGCKLDPEHRSLFSEMVVSFKTYMKGAIEYWKTRAVPRRR